MAKIPRSFRLETKTINRLEKLAKFYSEMQPQVDPRLPVPNQKLTNTDLIEFLINREFESLINDGYNVN